jgi:hypothetical protein
MEDQKVTHISLNSRYRVKIERAASTKGVLGYTVEANGDSLEEVVSEVESLKLSVEAMTPMSLPEAKEKPTAGL